MGMDLSGCDGSYFRFNWHGWGRLIDFLGTLDVSLEEFVGTNDGARVSSATCEQIAEAISTAEEEGRLYEIFGWSGGELDEKISLGRTNFFSQGAFAVPAGRKPPEPGLGQYLFHLKTKTIIAPKEPGYPPSLKKIAEAPVEELPILLAEYQEKYKGNSYSQDPLEMDLIEARLANRELDLSKRIPVESNEKNNNMAWCSLHYYLKFADFCAQCGGFEQW